MEFTYDPRYNVADIRFGKKQGKLDSFGTELAL
ncbi:MAG: hypothetical protein DDT32_01077 [Syntrophomonadaceae bacterium]|nr:hypothetical protein [Bacillota bacterium]